MLSPADIGRLATWLAATDICTLELREPGGTLRLERDGGLINISEHAVGETEAPARCTEAIRSDTPGIFLHGHPLRPGPLVEADAEVRPGQVVGLLRVGVLLLPVHATRAGRIEGYWAEDGAPVEYGAPLIELQVSEAAA